MFLERLLLLCDKKNTDISTVLRSLGLSTSKGTAWRKGSVPNGEILLMLAAHFHVSTDYLLGNTDDPRPVAELTVDGQKEKPAPQEGSELKMLTPDRYRELFKEMSSDELLSLISEATDELKERG